MVEIMKEQFDHGVKVQTELFSYYSDSLLNFWDSGDKVWTDLF